MPSGTYFLADGSLGNYSFYDNVLNAAGQVTFAATIGGNGYYGYSIWSQQAGVLELTARENTEARTSYWSEHDVALQLSAIEFNGGCGLQRHS